MLFIGGAQVPEAWGGAHLTLTAQTAVEAARELGDAPIAPIHQDGWAHFTSGAEDVERKLLHRAGLIASAAAAVPGSGDPRFT